MTCAVIFRIKALCVNSAAKKKKKRNVEPDDQLVKSGVVD